MGERRVVDGDSLINWWKGLAVMEVIGTFTPRHGKRVEQGAVLNVCLEGLTP